MSRKMPKTLYRYDLVNLTECRVNKYKVEIGDEFTCMEEQTLGTWFYRARQLGDCCYHDYYGYATLKDAKREYLLAVREEIGKLQTIVEKMEKKK